MYRKYFAAAFAASFLALLPTSASATVHTDPCPGQHVQVWSEVGNSGAGQATNHFVCGQVGKDGKDGADSNVPGPQGPAGPAGQDGADGKTGPEGAPGKDGLNGADSVVAGPAGRDGADGASGAAGPVGERGEVGAPGLVGPAGATGADGKATRGPQGKDGKAGVTKTVIVEADGTVTEISPLPETGGDSDTYRLAALGLGLTALGTAVVLIYRRRK